MFNLFHWRLKMKPANQTDHDSRNSSEIDPIARRLKSSTPDRFEVDVATHERILQKIDGRYALEKQSASPESIRSFATPRRLAIAGGLTATIAIAAFALESVQLPMGGSTVQRTITAAFIAKKALAAIEQPGMVTHYTFSSELDEGSLPTVYSNDPQAPIWQKEEPVSSQEECWVDRQNKTVKSANHATYRNGQETIASVLSKEGKSTVVMKSGDKVFANISNEAQEFPLPDLMNSAVEQYQELLREGKTKLLGEETIDGVPAYRLGTTYSNTNPDQTKTITESVNYVRKDTYQPLRSSYQTWEIKQGQKKTKLRSGKAFFGKVELLAREKLGKYFFTMSIPTNADCEISLLRFPLDEAKRFKEFDLCYLGNSFEGLELESMAYHKGDGLSPNRLVPDNQVIISYFRLTDRHDVSRSAHVGIMIRPLMDRGAIETLAPRKTIGYDQKGQKPIWGNPPAAQTIMIDGKPALLYDESRDSGTPKVTLFIQFGNATLQIQAKDKAQAIRVIRSLKKIN